MEKPNLIELDRPKPGPKPSERVFTIGVKKDAVGWRLIFAMVPESTLNNHVTSRTEPDLFEVMIGRIESALYKRMSG